MKNEGTVSGIKVFFKSHKRKKFIVAANADIKNYYKERNLEEIALKMKSDNDCLNSNLFFIDKIKAVSNKYDLEASKVVDNSVQIITAVNEFAVWDLYKELSCQTALLTAFPEKVFKDEITLAQMKALNEKIYFILSLTKNKLIEQKMISTFNSIMNKKDAEIDEYKALIELLK